MKKNILSVCLLCFCLSSFASSGVSEKLLQSFKETFPSAQQVQWQEFPDNYIVNFVVQGVRNRINYDKDGNLISATRYFGEENLPLNILTHLKKRFPNQKIFGVTELETDSNIEYSIKLQDNENWMTVKSDISGNLDVVEKYKRADQ